MRAILVLAVLLAGCTSAPVPDMPDGKNRVVDIVNTSDGAVQFLAVSAVRRGRRAPIEGTVAANYYLTLNFDNGSGACLFDFSAVFADGHRAEAKQFDTCAEVSWVVGP